MIKMDIDFDLKRKEPLPNNQRNNLTSGFYDRFPDISKCSCVLLSVFDSQLLENHDLKSDKSSKMTFTLHMK